MASFPTITLATPFVGQPAYTSSEVKVIKIDDDVDNKILRVFVQLGDNPVFKYWVPVLAEEAYTSDWSNDTINDAIVAYFTA